MQDETEATERSNEGEMYGVEDGVLTLDRLRAYLDGALHYGDEYGVCQVQEKHLELMVRELLLWRKMSEGSAKQMAAALGVQ